MTIEQINQDAVRTLKLIHVCPEVGEVFEITGFDSILTVE